MSRKRKPRSVLTKKNGSYYENGKLLPKEEYFYCSNCQDGNSIVSGRTGQKYRLNSKGKVI